MNNILKIGNKLFISYQYLKVLGIKEFTIDSWKKRDLGERIYIGKCAYMCIDSIPATSLKKLPSIENILAEHKNNEIQKKFEQKTQEKDLTNFAILSALQSGINNAHKYCGMYLETCRNTHNKVLEYAKLHAVFTVSKELCRLYKLIEIHKIYLQLTDIKANLKSYKRFAEKIRLWDASIPMLLHKAKGKSKENLIKFTDFHKGKAEQYLTHPNQYSLEKVAELVNKDCIVIGLKPICGKTVGNYYNANKARIDYYRNNPKFKRDVQPSTRRIAALHAGDLYYADGSPLQIICWNASGTQKIRLNLFVVMDTYSGKIVGFDLAENEDSLNWIDALKMAFSMEMYLPFEVVHDNASATKTNEFTTLKNELLVRGCSLNPDLKGNPKAKAKVERWFNTFQSVYQRMIDGYMGEGITSKRDNGRIDAAFWTKTIKKDHAYTYESMVQIVTYLIAIYNQTSKNSKAAPSTLFTKSPKPNATAIGKENIALLFWLHKQITVKNGEIAITIRHNQYYYQIYDHTLLLRINSKKVKVYYDEMDLSQVHVFDLDNKYIGEVRQKVAYHAAKANQTEEDVNQIIRQSKHNQAIATTIKKQTAEVANKAAEINPDVFYKVLSPFEVAKDEHNTSETKILLDYVKENKGIDQTKVKEYEPLKITSPLTKAEEVALIEKKYSKQFQDKNPTLQVVGTV